MTEQSNSASRRNFLKYLAASPLLAMGSSIAKAVGWDEEPANQALIKQWLEPLPETGGIVGSPGQAISIFDFERTARHNLPAAHYGYLASGMDDNASLNANRTGFDNIEVRQRRLIDVRKADTSVELFGETWKTPISLAPIGQLYTFHDDGEYGMAGACKKTGHQIILSTVATETVETVAEAKGSPIWFQLYPMWNWEISRGFIERADAVNCPVCVITVDNPTGGKATTIQRFRRLDDRTCSDCHTDFFDRKPMFEGLDQSARPNHENFRQALTWDFIEQVKGVTDMKVVIKGLETREDAQLAVDSGADGVIVSNHGGRAPGSTRGTIEALPEVAEGIDGRIPILLDGGIRRGIDVFKAIALGANAVSIGRPFVWGLASFGQAGIEAVLNMISSEFQLQMQASGVTSVDQINRSCVEIR
jgi:4-hydroxymandelate oxidase